MTDSRFNWSPIRAEQLRVGHFIRIDHNWFDHPFVRGTFQVASGKDIQIIREAGLTRLSVDHSRSNVAPRVEPVPEEVAGEPETTPAQHAAQLLEKKVAISRQQQSFRDAIAEARTRYLATVEESHALQARVQAGDKSCMELIKSQVDGVVRMQAGSEASLALVETAVPLQGNRRLAMRGNDATSLCAAIGKLMELSPQYTGLLLTAAAFHVVGLQTLQEHLKDETPGAWLNSDKLRAYPDISARMLSDCGASEEVVRIVREHRERPDGQGFPAGLQGDDMHPLAVIISTVREYQIRSAVPGGSPALALAYMYKNMRSVFGEEVICRLVAAVSVYPPGTTVQMTDGSIGRVLRVNPENRMRPVVGILSEGARSEDLEIVDLAHDDISIERALEAPVSRGTGQFQDAWLGLSMMPQARTLAVAQSAAAA